jgi:IS5 family transposase
MHVLGQPGFFDLDDCYAELSRNGDPLEALEEAVPWEAFRARLNTALRRSGSKGAGKGRGGRPPFDCVLMFKALVLQSLYNLSDDQTEYQIRDRLSFRRFLGLAVDGRVPDAKTIWLFRETLTQAGSVEKLFALFNRRLEEKGLLAMGGQIIDASFVHVPVQRNDRDENDTLKAGDVPEDWQDKPEKPRQKDTDARWAKKNNVSHYGYKNHINTDRRFKLIRKYDVTTAAAHDSTAFDAVFDPENTCADLWADSAYRSADREAELEDRMVRSHIHHKGHRNKPLSKHKQAVNKRRSKVRARVEHVFGHQENSMGGTLVRTIGIARAKAKIGLKNLAYNMQRYVYLRRTGQRCGRPAPA